jgi:hypothetical protein
LQETCLVGDASPFSRPAPTPEVVPWTDFMDTTHASFAGAPLGNMRWPVIHQSCSLTLEAHEIASALSKRGATDRGLLVRRLREVLIELSPTTKRFRRRGRQKSLASGGALDVVVEIWTTKASILRRVMRWKELASANRSRRLTGLNKTWQQKPDCAIAIAPKPETDFVISPRGIDRSTQCNALHSCICHLMPSSQPAD